MNFETQSERIQSSKSNRSYDLIRADQAIFSAAAAKQIASICSQPEVYKLFEPVFKGRPYGEKDAEFFIGHIQDGWKNGTNFHWIIFFKEEIVGTVGIKSIDGEIGYWQSNLHPGVMSLALTKICAFAETAGMPAFWAFVKRDNEASIRVLEKAGFKLDEDLSSKRNDAFGFRKLL